MVTSLFALTTNIRDTLDQAGVEVSGPGGQDLGAIFGNVFTLVLTLAGVGILFYFIWAGYNWLTAGDNPEKIQFAQARMINALIGITLVASAIAIGTIVSRFFMVTPPTPPSGVWPNCQPNEPCLSP